MNASVGVRAGALIVCLACAGCLSLPSKTPAPTLYALDRTLAAGGPAEAPARVVAASIAVDAPGGHVPVLGDDLVWRENDTIAFVSGVGWSGTARAALQRMVVESARAAGAGAAFANGEGGRAAFLVRWEVSHFEVLADGAPEAVLMLDAQLLNARTRELVGVRHVEEREVLADRSQTESARALRAVAQVGADQLGQWIVQQAAAAQTSAGAAKPASATP